MAEDAFLIDEGTDLEVEAGCENNEDRRGADSEEQKKESQQERKRRFPGVLLFSFKGLTMFQ